MGTENFFATPQGAAVMKHTVLHGYIRLFVGKLGSTHPTIHYLDGYAGPGVYADGSDGSPMLAADVATLVALRADAISRNPADGLRVPRGERQEMVFLTADQVFALADEVAHPPRPKRHQQLDFPTYGLLVRFAAFTGLRAGEIGALRIGRMAPDGRWVEVAESAEEVHGELIYGTPKTYARRRVEIPTALAVELQEHLATRPAEHDAFVFTTPDGGALRHSNFYRRHYKPAIARSDLDPRTRFHDLRHTAAAMMIGQGAHLLVVKERLGHSSITVTADRYGHLYPSLSAALTAQLEDVYTSAAGTGSARTRP